MDVAIYQIHPHAKLEASRGWLEHAHGLAILSYICGSQTTSTCHNMVLHSYLNHISFSIMHIMPNKSHKESNQIPT